MGHIHRTIHIAIVLAVHTGMRRSEICALRWEDVDLDVGKPSVWQSLEQTRAGLRFKDPKGGKARTLTLLRNSTCCVRRG